MCLKRFLYKNKEIIAAIIAMLTCAIIGADWKYISHQYPNHRQWVISFLGSILVILCYGQKEVKEIKDKDDITINFKDPFL